MFEQPTTAHLQTLSIGSAVVDIFISSASFSVSQHEGTTQLIQNFGDKVSIDSLQMMSGGGATNTAVAFQRLGFSAGLVAEMGKDNVAPVITSELSAAGVSQAFLIHERKEETGGSVILIGPMGQRIAMVHRGAAGMLDHADIPWPDLEGLSWVHISSLGDRVPLLHELDQYCAQHQLRWSWNPGERELHALTAGELPVPSPDIMFVNDREWGEVAAVQSQLQARIPIIVITKGKAGGVVLMGGMPAQSFTAAAVESVDDTGAGDAFAAAFVAAHIRGEEIATSIRWGVLNAAAVVQQIGAKPGLLTLDKLVRHQRWYDEMNT